MTKIITFRAFEEYTNKRLYDATLRLRKSLIEFNIDSWHPTWAADYIPIASILKEARLSTNHSFFIWCNTDVILTKDPFEGLDSTINYGFHRIERPSGIVNYGVDMYRINNDFYDDIMQHDIPDIVMGGDRVDWYLSRCLQKYSIYENLTGYIDHPSHERTPTSAGSDERGKHNIKEYNEWADRHGISKT